MQAMNAAAAMQYLEKNKNCAVCSLPPSKAQSLLVISRSEDGTYYKYREDGPFEVFRERMRIVMFDLERVYFGVSMPKCYTFDKVLRRLKKSDNLIARRLSWSHSEYVDIDTNGIYFVNMYTLDERRDSITFTESDVITDDWIITQKSHPGLFSKVTLYAELNLPR